MAKLKFDHAFDPVHGSPVQLSPLVERITCNNPSAFTFHGTATYVVGGSSVAVIDPGPDDDDHFEAILKATAGRTISHIVITHTHRDHSPLAARLQDMTGATTYGHGPHGAGRPARASASGEVRLDASGDMDFVPDVALAHGDVVQGRDWNLECVFTPGHCANHMAYALKEDNALFSGDHVMAWSTSVIAPPDGNMADYMASLQVLLGREEAVYFPGHGPEKSQPRAFVRAFMTHRRMREEAILSRFKQGDRTIAEVVASVYSGIDRRLHPAAAMSTLAHVEHLLEQGRLKTDAAASLGAEYRVP